MKIGALIIGDEILSGKRQDRHFAHLQEVLAARGLELSWSLIVGDDAADLERAMRFSMASDDLVFSFGGIGATPDDRTRQTAALVKGVPLVPHPQAVKEIEDKFGEAAYPNRILMGHLPEGCRLIPNPVNRVAGFSVDNHHFMPGFPEMAWPMVETDSIAVDSGSARRSATSASVRPASFMSCARQTMRPTAKKKNTGTAMAA